jgi:hypothetical protein
LTCVCRGITKEARGTDDYKDKIRRQNIVCSQTIDDAREGAGKTALEDVAPDGQAICRNIADKTWVEVCARNCTSMNNEIKTTMRETGIWSKDDAVVYHLEARHVAVEEGSRHSRLDRKRGRRVGEVACCIRLPGQGRQRKEVRQNKWLQENENFMIYIRCTNESLRATGVCATERCGRVENVVCKRNTRASLGIARCKTRQKERKKENRQTAKTVTAAWDEVELGAAKLDGCQGTSRG